MSSRVSQVFAVVGLILAAGCGSSNPVAPDVAGHGAVPTTQGLIPPFAHVIVLIMENHEYDGVIGNPRAPYVNSLAATHGLATNYTAVTHPSLPNYMALTSGATIFSNDCTNCTTTVPSIADLIESSGRRWKAYLEDMPVACGTSDAGGYRVKHNPFVHYVGIVSNRSRCTASVVPLTELSGDLAANRLPDFVWITPNDCHNTHDCDVSVGDSWLAGFVPTLIVSPAFAGSVLFIVWDEGDSAQGGGGRVPMLVVSPDVRGKQSAAAHSHYGLLRTIEDAWALAPLGQSSLAPAMSEFWR